MDFWYFSQAKKRLKRQFELSKSIEKHRKNTMISSHWRCMQQFHSNNRGLFLSRQLRYFVVGQIQIYNIDQI